MGPGHPQNANQPGSPHGCGPGFEVAVVLALLSGEAREPRLQHPRRSDAPERGRRGPRRGVATPIMSEKPRGGGGGAGMASTLGSAVPAEGRAA